MGLLNSLERLLVPSRREKATQVELKEIFCKRKDDDFLKRFRVAAVGTKYTNPDGSDRQQALEKLKVGERVRLIWDAGASDKKYLVYLLRCGKAQKLSMPDCFGRLDDKTAADVCRWMATENIVTAARVAKVVGGNRKRPKLGCVLELTTYHGPRKKQ